jgi:hypothetical protein
MKILQMHEIKQLLSDSLRIILNSVLLKYSQNTLRPLPKDGARYTSEINALHYYTRRSGKN